MKCNKCQHSLPDDSAFCQYCGNPIVAESVPNKENAAVDPAMSAQKVVMAVPVAPVELTPKDLSESPAIIYEDQPEESMNIEKANILNQPNFDGETVSNLVPREPLTALTDFTVTDKDDISIRELNPIQNRKFPDAPKIPKTTFCKKCGGQVDHVTKKCTKCETQYFDAKKLPVIITSVFLMVFVILSTFLFIKNLALIKQTAEMEGTINALNNEISEKNNKVKSLQTKANYYDDILKALRTGSIGHASASFSTSESIILINKNTVGRKFTLHTTWNAGATIDVDYFGSSAVVSFDNSSWYDSTTLTVVPKHEGITAVTFSNDLNSDTFTVLIIVVP